MAELPAPIGRTGFARDARGVLACGGRGIDELLVRAGVGTPAYLYDLDSIVATAHSIVGALGPRDLCAYAVKANSAAPIVGRVVGAGCGVDVVSGGELRVALACGTDPSRIVYSGVAKRDDEVDLAIARGIRAIHAESVEEIVRITARARAVGRRGVPVGLRVNPSVEVDTHANIATGHDAAKFGVARDDLPRALEAIDESDGVLELVGVGAHVGSQLMSVAPYLASLARLCDVAREVLAAGHSLHYLDAGGGYGVAYRSDQQGVPPAGFVVAARELVRDRGLGDLALVIEPGRALVAPYGVLVARVVQPKRSRAGGVDLRWLLIDAGMNDLIRPALYQAHHRVEPLTAPGGPADVPWRVAGPVCESSDDFGVHLLPDPPPPIVVIRDAGAYGRAMASTYNSRPRAAEVFVSAGEVVAVRAADSIEATVREALGTDP